MSSPFIEMMESPAVQPYLPFFFTLAVVYGLLTIIGDENKGLFKKSSVNLIIALVFAFFAAGWQPFVEFFFTYFGLILWAFIGIFFIAFFKKALGTGDAGNKDKVIFSGIILLVFVSVFTILRAYFPRLEVPVLGTGNFLFLVGLFLILYMFYNAHKMNGG